MLKRFFAMILYAVTIFATASPALAQNTLFTVTGPNTASFVLPTSPTPTSVQNGYNFTVANRPIILNGASVTRDLTFFTTADGGGISISGAFFNFGPQIFTGTTAAPTFTWGTYAMSGGYSVTLEDIGSAPEPAAWAFMLGGFATMGAAIRRRRRVAAATASVQARTL